MPSEMIPEPETYFKQYIPLRDDLLLEMEQEAVKEQIPIIGPVVGELLYILARSMQAKHILELGTATGYSTIFLARACDATGGYVTTIEYSKELVDRARLNFRKAGLDHRIRIRTGDARDELKLLKGPFDMIFLDIDKIFYVSVLPLCSRLLKSGGLLIADNVGFVDSKEFNTSIYNNPEWRSIHLFSFLPNHSPEHDGLCFALRV